MDVEKESREYVLSARFDDDDDETHKYILARAMASKVLASIHSEHEVRWPTIIENSLSKDLFLIFDNVSTNNHT